LADSFAAFLAGARLAGLFAGARRTALLADRFAVFLAGARVVALLAGARLTTLPTGLRADALAGDLRIAVLVDFLAAFFRAFLAAGVVALAAFLAGAGEAFSAGRGALPLTLLFSVLLAEKRTPLDAATFTGAPVCGLRPIRAPRCVGLKLPNPTTTTRRPARISVTTEWSNALTASSDSRFVNVVVLLIASIKPDLFTRRPPPCSGIPSIKEGFGVKVKHCRCWRKLTREVSRKVARWQLCGGTLGAHGATNNESTRLDKKP
jgi:hypothetical protein